MKNKLGEFKFILLIIFLGLYSFSQTDVKINLFTAPFLIPNFAFESGAYAVQKRSWAKTWADTTRVWNCWQKHRILSPRERKFGNQNKIKQKAVPKGSICQFRWGRQKILRRERTLEVKKLMVHQWVNFLYGNTDRKIYVYI